MNDTHDPMHFTPELAAEFMLDDEMPAGDVQETPEPIVDETVPEVLVEPVEPETEPADPATVVEPDPEDWQKRYQELQSHKDQQIRDMEAQMKVYKSLFESVPDTPDAPPPPQITKEQLDEGVKAAPVDTFRYVAENRPDMVPSVIASIRKEHGHDLADQATFAYQQYMLTQQQQAIQAQMDEQQAPQRVMQFLNSTVEQVAARHGDDFQRLAPRTNELLSEIVASNGELTPDNVAIVVEQAFLQAYKEEISASKKVESLQPKPITQNDVVPTGTPGTAPPAPTAEDEIADEIVAAYSRNRYV